MENTKRIYLSALVYNRTGVLLRVAGLFARRGYNVVSLTVSETESPEFSRMTIVSDIEEYKVAMVMQQLSRLEEVIKVINLDEGQAIQSEILLIKVHTLNKDRKKVLKTINSFGARVMDIGHTTITAELTGLPSLIDKFIDTMEKYGICELSRSGLTALESGDRNIKGAE